MSKSDWIESVYLDLDVTLAELKADDWLASDIDIDVVEEPKTSVATGTFWSGHEYDHWRREYEKRRASLQQCGSRHAHEDIQAVGMKETGPLNANGAYEPPAGDVGRSGSPRESSTRNKARSSDRAK